MLSFKDNKNNTSPIAIKKYDDDDKNKKILYISNDINERPDMPDNFNPLDYISVDEIRQTKKYLNTLEVRNIIEHLKKLDEPKDNELMKIYNDSLDIIFSRLGKVIKINDHSHFEYIPDITTEREIIYISGASGSGKSHFAAQYMKKYHSLTNNDVILFSNVDNDTLFNNLDYVHKMNLNDVSIYNDPIKLDELSNKLIIFDDAEQLKSKIIQKAIDDLKTLILEQGRHKNISFIITSHLTSNYAKTRTIISELNIFVCFPHSNSRYHITRFLKVYVGLSKEEINRIFKLNTRWVLVHLKTPRFILAEKECFILN